MKNAKKKGVGLEHSSVLKPCESMEKRRFWVAKFVFNDTT
jgi:hypothetical protein